MLHDIFFSKKAKTYRVAVVTLLPELGLDMTVFSPLAPRDTMVERFRLQGFTEHEAALIIGYSSLTGFLQKNGRAVAEALYDTLVERQAQWTSAGYIKSARAKDWPATGRKHLSGTPADSGQPEEG